MAARSIVHVLLLVAAFAALGSSARAQSLDVPQESRPTRWEAPALRISLATTFVGLQALDVVSTLRGVHGGSATEANPLMRGLANQPAALVAVKSGLTAATVLSMNAWSRKHPKAATIAMIALNAGSAFVVGSNFRVVVGN